MKRTLFLLLAYALLAAGCNTVNLAYRNADWYLQHRIGDYATFDARQEAAIRQDVRDYVHWHREQALPLYIAFLQNLNGAAQSAEPLAPGDAAHLRSLLHELYRMTMQPMIAPAAHILAGMNGKQVLELERYLAEEGRERRQEMLGTGHEEYLVLRSKRTLSFMHWLAGSLSDDQERRIVELSRSLPVTAEIYMQQREARQRRLVEMLKAGADEVEIETFLADWLYAPEAGYTPDQRQAMQEWELATNRMIANIHALLTPRQREHINDLLSSYIADMRDAIASGRKD
ncbi:MAG TPA: DUF6279 family lipoprotein [Gallionella sp.]